MSSHSRAVQFVVPLNPTISFHAESRQRRPRRSVSRLTVCLPVDIQRTRFITPQTYQLQVSARLSRDDASDSRRGFQTAGAAFVSRAAGYGARHEVPRVILKNGHVSARAARASQSASQLNHDGQVV